MKTILVLMLLVAVVSAFSTEDMMLFKSWARENGKTYDHAEFYFRLVNFVHGLGIIKEHNSQESSYKLGMNPMGDLSDEEFKMYFTGLEQPLEIEGEIAEEKPVQDLPEEIDWEKLGAVTPVKDQAACGSCWAFSTTGSLEGAVFTAHKKLISLSESQLVDCSSSFGNHGCQGGLMTNAFKFIMKNGGLCTEEDYPYKAVTNKCQLNCTVEPLSQIDDFKNVPAQDEDQLKAFVAEGPVSVALQADQSGFRYYKSGVFDGTCGHSLNHGVLCVGYGNEDAKDYWRVKNSWGPTWGDHGYIKLVRHEGKGYGQCGIAMMDTVPVINKSG